MTSFTTRIDLAVTLRPRVPKGDARDAATAVLNTVVERSLAWSDELRTIANEHLEAAPASSEHVLDLNATISRAVLEWVERWPR
jgi:hypothetical protein